MAGNASNRSGVALIIVLGLVAILMIISVAFAIHMRVERAGAANLRHAAVARQIVKGGMAAAIAAIDADEFVKDNIVAQWCDTNDVENLVYGRRDQWLRSNGALEKCTTNFWKGTLVSYDPKALEHVTAHFPTAVDDYLPSGLKYRSFANRYSGPGETVGGKAVLQPEWLPVFSDLGNDDVIGRYSYFVLDTTGMLDANAGYGDASRGLGRETREVQLVSAIPHGDDVKVGKYVSVAELEKINAKLKLHNIWWNTFSYEPTNALVNIGGDADDLRNNKEKIIEAFYDCGLQAGKSFGNKDCEQARWAYLGLVDYVDEDYDMEPDDKIQPSERPATERMPLVSGALSELTIEVRRVLAQTSAGNTTADDVQVRVSGRVKVPFVFPFYENGEEFNSTDRKGVKLEGKARLSVSGGMAPLAKRDSKLVKEELSLESPKKKDDDQCIVSPIDIDEYEEKEGDTQGWVTIKKKPSLAERLKLPGIAATLQVAGATYRDNKLQHCFPVGENGYEKMFDKSKSYGMVIDFKPEKEGVEFGENDDGIEKKEETDESGNTTITWTWQPKKVVVWAEIVDPRFANQWMETDYDEDEILACCKVSHGNYEVGTSSHGKTLLQLGLAEAVKFQNDFNAAKTDADREAVCGKWGDKPEDATDKTYGYYFGGLKSTRVGSGPFASHLMADPGEAYKFYEMPMDGMQKGADSEHTDKPKSKWDMFVKNKPLESVGELGYLPIGFWQTIRLYDYGDDFGVPGQKTVSRISDFNKLPEDPQARNYPSLHDNGNDYHEGGFFHAVSDYFSVVNGEESGKGEEPVKGRIDLNASPRDVLASAFNEMQVGKPDGRLNKAINKINQTDAYLIADAIIESRNNRGNFCSASELGYIYEEPYADTVPPLYGTGNLRNCVKAVNNAAGSNTRWGEWERESIIRNSCGLFATRGQSYLIIVRGESYSPRYGHRKSLIGGNSNASKTAIAQIWRDPVPDGNGKHPIFVKFFKIIDD